MLFHIRNLTGVSVEVWWRRENSPAGEIPLGRLEPDQEVLAVDALGCAVDLHLGETTTVRALLADGRTLFGGLTVTAGQENAAEIALFDTGRSCAVLTLPEELLLLATDEHGRIRGVPWENLELGLFAAGVLELEFRHRLELWPEAIHLLDMTPSSDAVLNQVIAVLKDLDQPGSLEEVLQGLAYRAQTMFNAVVGGLVARGILRVREGRLLWLVPSWSFPTLDEGAESSVTLRLLRVLLFGEPPDPRTAALLAILAGCFTSERYLRQELLHDLNSRLREVIAGAGESIQIARRSVTAAVLHGGVLYAPEGQTPGPHPLNEA